MRAYTTKYSRGSKPKDKVAVIWADDVQDNRMEDRLGLLNATIKLNGKPSRQEWLRERAEKEQEEIRLEAWNRVRNVDERLVRAGLKLKKKHSSRGKKEPEEQKKEKTVIRDLTLDERLLQAATKLKVKLHRREMTPHVRDNGPHMRDKKAHVRDKEPHVRDKEKGSNEEGDETARDANHSPLDDRLLNPTIKLKVKHSSKQYRIVNPSGLRNQKKKNKNRLLHPTIKVREHIVILPGSSASLDSQHVYCENYHGGSSAAPISITSRSLHTDVAHASSHDTSSKRPFQKREMRLRELKGDDSNSCLAVGSDENIQYSANTSVQNHSVASTQTDFDLLAIDETKPHQTPATPTKNPIAGLASTQTDFDLLAIDESKPQQTLTTQTKSPMVGLFGMFWGCNTTLDAQLDSEKKLKDKNSGVQVNEDMLDYVFNDVEGFACRKKEEDLRDIRILPKPALKYKEDALDKVCEPMESMVCRAGRNEPGVNLTKNTQEGLLDYVFNDVESLVCRQSKYATHIMGDHNYETDVFDKVFEPLESIVCQHDVPEARRRAASNQSERICDRLHESAIRSEVFREAKAGAAGIQSTRDAHGTGPIPLLLQYNERDVLDNVFESMESLVCLDPSVMAKHQRQRIAFEPAESVSDRDDSPAVGGYLERNTRDEPPTEPPRNKVSRASRAAVTCKQDAPGFRGERYSIAKKERILYAQSQKYSRPIGRDDPEEERGH